MRKVWSLTLSDLSITETTVRQLPQGAEILTAQFQLSSGRIKVWALVEADRPMEDRTFRVYGTDHALEESPDRLTYIATTQQGPFVWHVFEVDRPSFERKDR